MLAFEPLRMAIRYALKALFLQSTAIVSPQLQETNIQQKQNTLINLKSQKSKYNDKKEFFIY